MKDIFPGDLLVCKTAGRTFVTRDFLRQDIIGLITHNTEFNVTIISLPQTYKSQKDYLVYGLTSLGHLGWMVILDTEITTIVSA